jgi:predicted nucleotide-binding protein
VIFELGWFSGKIGIENVSIVGKKGTAIPSDLDGIMRIDYEFKIEEQYKKIMTELKASGLI